MIIRVVETQGVPTAAEAEENVVWSGGYGHTGTDDADGFSASILAALLPEFEIGTWYQLADFKEKLANARVEETDAWSTVTMTTKEVEGMRCVEIPVPHGLTAKLVCESIVEHISRLHDNVHLWVRVE
jgi:hypothetical protein